MLGRIWAHCVAEFWQGVADARKAQEAAARAEIEEQRAKTAARLAINGKSFKCALWSWRVESWPVKRVK